MIFEFRALVAGGRGPDIWDQEVIVSGEDMTFRQALDAVEEKFNDTIDFAVVSLEQLD